ncbi:hypothetical protein AGMMS49573_10480 [Endomicrobiia bacterium]|nr:hypothetical protein AGMMS49573_10480 [Endomicrobiia bacterium]
MTNLEKSFRNYQTAKALEKKIKTFDAEKGIKRSFEHDFIENIVKKYRENYAELKFKNG